MLKAVITTAVRIMSADLILLRVNLKLRYKREQLTERSTHSRTTIMT